jgi:Dolichyl-phosphate-mannose-protein mannosyltransferase
MKRLLPYNKIIVIMLVVYSAIQIYCINQLSINYDEGSFASYGASLLKFQREKDVMKYESKLPITALNMLPRAIEQVLHPNLKRNWPGSTVDIIRGRYISLFISLLLGILIFQWSKQLYNEKTALFILLLFLLCPNFLAHGIFVSSDIFACFFMTLSLYYLWNFFLSGKRKHFVFMSIATGLAEISKFSMIHLFPIIILLSILAQINTPPNKGSINRFNFKRVLIYSSLFILINWAVICFSHLFFGVFQPVKDYTFMSTSFRNLQLFISGIFPRFPIPLPSSYVSSMDAVVYFDQLGGGVKGSLNGAPYILGNYSVNGFWYYYLVVLFFKLPIPILLLWLGSTSLTFKNFRKATFFKNEVFFILPALYFLIYMSFFYSTQVGIRHIMIIFPLLFVLSGKLLGRLLEGKNQLIVYSLLACQFISVFRYFPHFLPYTNEFILEKRSAYKRIADTNLCYGEGEKYLQEYMAAHRDAILQPNRPIPGKIVMEVNDMLNLNISSIHKYDWISSLQPVAHIHSQYLVFEVTKQQADSLQKIYH